MKRYHIAMIMTFVLFASIFNGCATMQSGTPGLSSSNASSVYMRALGEKNAVRAGSERKVSVYGVRLNERFSGRSTTRRYRIDENGDVRFDIGEREGKGLWYVRMGLEPSTKVVKEIVFYTSSGPDADCLTIKDSILSGFYDRYGGVMFNDATYRDTGSFFGTTTRMLESRGELDLDDILIDASCNASRQYGTDLPSLLTYNGKIIIAENKDDSERLQYQALLGIHDINTTPLNTPKEAKSTIATGTGFFISDDGYLLTNHHVVNGGKRHYVLINGNKIDAELIDSDAENDIAILKIGHATRPLTLQLEKSLTGSEITVIGYPSVAIQGNEKKSTFGYINALSGLKGDPRQYQISAPIQAGNSGSPLINDRAEVIGVVVSTINQSAMLKTTGIMPQNVNYAVKIRHAINMLEKNAIVYKRPQQTDRLSKPDLIRNSADSVVLVMSEMH